MKKIALITGSSRGIGKATALLAADHGYDVCVNYAHDADSAQEVVRLCQAKNVRAICVQADISDRDAVQRLFETCDAQLGAVNLLVNNAGIIGQASALIDLPQSVLEATFAINVYGAFYCAQEAVRRMAKSGGGAGGVIINVSSTAAKLGSPFEYIHYAASKGAVESFTIGLSKEVGCEGIRVNAVRSGTADTEIHTRGGNPNRPAEVARTAPLGRVAAPNDIAEAIMWLASDKAGFATGAILKVSGGL